MNKLRQGLHISAKLFSFFLFGSGALAISTLLFPLIIILPVSRSKKDHLFRQIVRLAFHLFIWNLKILRLVKLNIQGKEFLNMGNGVICSNHPTLLDVVFLAALVPPSTCIVKSALWKNFFLRRMVSALYIPNSRSPGKIMKESKSMLDKGLNLILFPEGGRTIPEAPVHLHRGAARVALESGYDVIPVHIGVVHPTGLGKYEKLLSAPKGGRVEYSIKIKEAIPVNEFTDLPMAKASRALTRRIQTAIMNEET